MHNFSWFEKRGTDGTPLPKSVRTLLRNELPTILPKTRIVNSNIMDEMLSGTGRQVPVSSVIRECMLAPMRSHSLVNSLVCSSLHHIYIITYIISEQQGLHACRRRLHRDNSLYCRSCSNPTRNFWQVREPTLLSLFPLMLSGSL
jgi:hypothetical protein